MISATMAVPRPLGSPAPARPAAPSSLVTVGAAAGAGVSSALVGEAATMGTLWASLPASAAIISATTAPVEGLFGTIYYVILAQAGTVGGIAAAAGVGIAAGILATREAPQNAGAVRRFFEKPAAALRDGFQEVSSATSLGSAMKAGGKAGWKAGQTVGTVAGALQGLASGYALGMIGVPFASLPLAITASIGCGLVGAAALGLAGRYIGGASGALVGSIAGAAGYPGQ